MFHTPPAVPWRERFSDRFMFFPYCIIPPIVEKVLKKRLSFFNDPSIMPVYTTVIVRTGRAVFPASGRGQD
jgi:hypothetical protein